MTIKLYQVYDGENSSIWEDDFETGATTGKEAIMKLLIQTKRGHYKIRRSKEKDVLFKAQGFYLKDGRKYRDGNAIWYARIWE